MRTTAGAGGQLFGLPEKLEDTEAIRLARDRTDYRGLLELGKALSASLRYREAAEVYNRAVSLQPESLEAHRLLAGRYLSTLQPEKALAELRLCREMGGEESDLSYRIGLAHFWLEDYESSAREMARCFEVSSSELGIAAIYWNMIASWRSGKEPGLLEQYSPGMDVGHHTGYAFSVRAAAEHWDPYRVADALDEQSSDLEYSMMAYGLAEYFRARGLKTEAGRLHSSILKRGSFWISYAYLAEWRDQFGLPRLTQSI